MMQGAFWVLIAALLIFATSLLMHRFIDGHWTLTRLPITWFYASWLLGLVLLAMPLYSYTEAFTGENSAYVLGMLFAFSAGSVIAAFWASRSLGPGLRRLAIEPPKTGIEAPLRLIYALLALGMVGTTLLMLNSVLAGGLSLGDRLDSDNFAAIRSAQLMQTESYIGPLYGPSALMSSIGGLGVAYAFYLRGARIAPTTGVRWMRRFAVLLVLFNVLIGFIGFSSRVFGVFAILVAFFAFVEGRWAIGERLIVKRPTVMGAAVMLFSTIVTLVALWFAATLFLEKRVQRQDPQRLLFKTHRASFAPLVYDATRKDMASQYFMFSLSYLTTPIPTLTFYLDLPESRQPGPFFGEYNFPAVGRWVRRATFTADPYAWEAARYEIFKPLGDIGFGTNVWATMPRDLIADFGKYGSLLFIAGLGFFSQRIFDRQRASPSVRLAGLLVHLRLILAFAGLISILFMTQINWALYLAVALAIGAGRVRPAKRVLVPNLLRPLAPRR